MASYRIQRAFEVQPQVQQYYIQQQVLQHTSGSSEEVDTLPQHKEDAKPSPKTAVDKLMQTGTVVTDSSTYNTSQYMAANLYPGTAVAAESVPLPEKQHAATVLESCANVVDESLNTVKNNQGLIPQLDVSSVAAENNSTDLFGRGGADFNNKDDVTLMHKDHNSLSPSQFDKSVAEEMGQESVIQSHRQIFRLSPSEFGMSVAGMENPCFVSGNICVPDTLSSAEEVPVHTKKTDKNTEESDKEKGETSKEVFAMELVNPGTFSPVESSDQSDSSPEVNDIASAEQEMSNKRKLFKFKETTLKKHHKREHRKYSTKVTEDVKQDASEEKLNSLTDRCNRKSRKHAEYKPKPVVRDRSMVLDDCTINSIISGAKSNVKLSDHTSKSTVADQKSQADHSVASEKKFQWRLIPVEGIPERSPISAEASPVGEDPRQIAREAIVQRACNVFDIVGTQQTIGVGLNHELPGLDLPKQTNSEILGKSADQQTSTVMDVTSQCYYSPSSKRLADPIVRQFLKENLDADFEMDFPTEKNTGTTETIALPADGEGSLKTSATVKNDIDVQSPPACASKQSDEKVLIKFSKERELPAQREETDLVFSTKVNSKQSTEPTNNSFEMHAGATTLKTTIDDASQMFTKNTDCLPVAVQKLNYYKDIQVVKSSLRAQDQPLTISTVLPSEEDDHCVVPMDISPKASPCKTQKETLGIHPSHSIDNPLVSFPIKMIHQKCQIKSNLKELGSNNNSLSDSPGRKIPVLVSSKSSLEAKPSSSIDIRPSSVMPFSSKDSKQAGILSSLESIAAGHIPVLMSDKYNVSAEVHTKYFDQMAASQYSCEPQIQASLPWQSYSGVSNAISDLPSTEEVRYLADADDSRVCRNLSEMQQSQQQADSSNCLYSGKETLHPRHMMSNNNTCQINRQLSPSTSSVQDYNIHGNSSLHQSPSIWQIFHKDDSKEPAYISDNFFPHLADSKCQKQGPYLLDTDSRLHNVTASNVVTPQTKSQQSIKDGRSVSPRDRSRSPYRSRSSTRKFGSPRSDHGKSSVQLQRTGSPRSKHSSVHSYSPRCSPSRQVYDRHWKTMESKSSKDSTSTRRKSRSPRQQYSGKRAKSRSPSKEKHFYKKDIRQVFLTQPEKIDVKKDRYRDDTKRTPEETVSVRIHNKTAYTRHKNKTSQEDVMNRDRKSTAIGGKKVQNANDELKIMSSKPSSSLSAPIATDVELRPSLTSVSSYSRHIDSNKGPHSGWHNQPAFSNTPVEKNVPKLKMQNDNKNEKSVTHQMVADLRPKYDLRDSWVSRKVFL